MKDQTAQGARISALEARRQGQLPRAPRRPAPASAETHATNGEAAPNGNDMPASSDEIQIAWRTRLFCTYACVTSRSVDEILDPRFFSSVALERFDRIEVTCLADPARPVHMVLVTDATAPRDRTAVTKVISQVEVERLLPLAPEHRDA